MTNPEVGQIPSAKGMFLRSSDRMEVMRIRHKQTGTRNSTGTTSARKCMR